jgi:hypothetical protein
VRGNVLQQDKRVLPKNGSGHVALYFYASSIVGYLLQQQQAVLFKKCCRENGHGRSNLA